MGGPDRTKIARCCAIIGVDITATQKQIKKAYHAKVIHLHPDLHPDNAQATKAFKKVNAAYEYLKKNMKSLAKDNAPVPDEKNITPAPPAAKRTDPAENALPVKLEISMDELVFRLRNSQNEFLRMHSVKAIAETGGREAAWALLPALDDRSPRVAAAAISALGSLNTRLAAAPLIHMYPKAARPLKPLIVQALEKIDSSLASRFLVENNLSSQEPASAANPDLRRIATDLLNA